jgi:alpha-tubulin suppressor-like RCC1 family protein
MPLFTKVDNIWKQVLIDEEIIMTTLYVCGSNNSGQLGLGNTADRSTLTQVGSDTNWQSVSSGGPHTLAVKTNGTLWACGRNIYGQLGLNNTAYQSTLTQVGSDTNWQSVSCGDTNCNHTVAIKTNGTLWACGYNGSTDNSASTT